MSIPLPSEPPYAVSLDGVERPAVEVLVNFGVAAGRKPTGEEVDELARAVKTLAGTALISVESRYEVGTELDVRLDTVRIEVPEDALLGQDVEEARTELVRLAGDWALACRASPGQAETLAERIAREAVAGEDRPARD